MIRVIVTDIEGTTTSIRFVHEVLFPYARQHLAAYVREHQQEAFVAQQLDAVAAASGCSREDLEGLIGTLENWIDEDRKETSLKALQGLLWEQGYRQRAFEGHVYPDAAEYLRFWHDRGLRLYVYSSGSVQAQKLIFGFSNEGDLTPYFSGYFDTNTGGKREPASYQAILDQLGVDPATVLFLSDIEEELEAAEARGLTTCWLIREGQLPEEAARPVARDFREVDALLLQR